MGGVEHKHIKQLPHRVTASTHTKFPCFHTYMPALPVQFKQLLNRVTASTHIMRHFHAFTHSCLHCCTGQAAAQPGDSQDVQGAAPRDQEGRAALNVVDCRDDTPDDEENVAGDRHAAKCWPPWLSYCI
jgi:hypothetical protein